MAVGWNRNTREAFRQLMQERRFAEVLANPPECSLSELRRSCYRSQSALAEALGVGQLQVSRLERRADPHVATLQRYVAALGGRLELIVRLPHRAVRLRIGSVSRHSASASPKRTHQDP